MSICDLRSTQVMNKESKESTPQGEVICSPDSTMDIVQPEESKNTQRMPRRRMVDTC